MCPLPSDQQNQPFSDALSGLTSSVKEKGKVATEDLLAFHAKMKDIEVSHFNTKATVNLVEQKY